MYISACSRVYVCMCVYVCVCVYVCIRGTKEWVAINLLEADKHKSDSVCSQANCSKCFLRCYNNEMKISDKDPHQIVGRSFVRSLVGNCMGILEEGG